MSTKTYQECTYCVMDTSDPVISFDSEGRCNHCRSFESLLGTVWFPNDEGQRRLDTLIEKVTSYGDNKKFDSILGLSGGIDSSFLALKAREWGLRPLVVHVDAGWNSELAVQNIQRVVDYCGYELHTHVVDWEDMRQLHLSYLRAAVSNQDVPQDHAFFAALYNFATKNSIRFVLNGGNVATEGIFPTSWHGPAMDARNLKAIHRQFGEKPLQHYPTISFSRYYFWYPIVKRMTPLRPLNLMTYSKEEAVSQLEVTGWKPYPRKHGESIFTKFFQNYYLPTKFGYDKRRPHLSSLIASGQMTRENALTLLREPLYEADELRRDIEFLCRKLRISRSEFEHFLQTPEHLHTDFPNYEKRYRLVKEVQSFLSAAVGKQLGAYR